MHRFELWAPDARKVRVRLGDATYAMQGPSERGMWTAEIAAAEYGMDYAFLVNGDPTPYPDPRSAWQPHGVHGMSRLYDQSAFAWHDEHWQAPPLETAVIYELHVGTFTPQGTFDEIVERLNYLVANKITHVEIMPVAAFPGEHGWGYDGVSLFAVHDRYGGPDGMKRLVDACHAHGLAVILDVVYNHFGPTGNYTGKFGPYTTRRHHTPWGAAINFEAEGSDEVRRFFCDNALMWMRDYHVDGLRLDAVHEFSDRSAIHFMEQLSTEVDRLSASLGRRLVLIADSDLNDARVVTPHEAHGFGMDAQWSDDFHHALFAVLHPEKVGYYVDFGSVADLAKALTSAFVLDGAYSRYRRRSHGRPVEEASAHRFLGYIQNHDQVGNRVTGDRLEHIVGLARAKVALGIVLTAPFIPMLFQGEEFAASTPFLYFADHEDPKMARAVSEGRRREFATFGWSPADMLDPDRREAWERSCLNWDEVRTGYHAEMLEWTRSLIDLRRSSPSLNDGDLGHIRVRFDEEKRWLIMERGAVLTMCNLGPEPVELPNPDRLGLQLVSQPEVERTPSGVQLPPDSLAILSGEGR